LLASLGYRALATTSAGHAFSIGKPDTPTAMTRDIVLAHIREIVEATELPVNADFQAGYGDSAEAVADSIALCVDTGVAGLSVEDATGDTEKPLFDRDVALDRVRAARSAIDASGRDVVLSARAECFLVGHSDPLAESIARLVSFADAGADCLYAPGLRTPEQIRAVVEAVAPTPVNVLSADPSWMTVDALRELGVRRISVGSAMARVAWKAFIDVARGIAEDGSFSGLSGAEPFATLDALFAGS
jgi:2-methylisocitrate lyase-like PEP mutase family enzyme